MFNLVRGGIGVMPDPAHVNPHHDTGTRISFQVISVGDEGATRAFGVELDDVFVTEWQSAFLEPGNTATGFASLGRRKPRRAHSTNLRKSALGQFRSRD
jgi:hypothetical protein